MLRGSLNTPPLVFLPPDVIVFGEWQDTGSCHDDNFSATLAEEETTMLTMLVV